MIQLTFKQPANIDTQRHCVSAVQAGVPYLMTNYHVGQSIPREVCSRLEPYENVQAYEGQPLDHRSLLILWLAGMGDTISFAPALLSLQQQHPQARIDLLTIPVLYEILQSAGFRGTVVSYPALTEVTEAYDYFLPLEEIGRDPACLQLDSIDFAAKLLGQPAGLAPPTFLIDEAARKKMRLPAGPLIRAGIQVKGLSPLRTYPSDLLAQVLRGLVRGGYEVHLLGAADDCPAPSAPPRLYNDCGKTATFSETAALVEQMQVMICPDSYLLHLAGVLRIPTVAVFSTIAPHLRVSRYLSVVALAPDLPCSPCSVVQDDRCPMGHSECVALRTAPVSPEVILKTAQSLILDCLAREDVAPPQSQPTNEQL